MALETLFIRLFLACKLSGIEHVYPADRGSLGELVHRDKT